MSTTATKGTPFDVGPIQLMEETQQRDGLASSKDEYRAFCQQEDSMHIFARDWWLDAAVGPEGWDVAIVKKDDVIVAAMPYVRRRRMGMKILTQPALTPMLGPWLRQLERKPAAQMSAEKELMQALIDQLPPFDHFAQSWDPRLQNWQPFFWNGFRQTTYYTLALPDLSDPEKLWAGLDSKVRRLIRKLQKENRLHVRDDLPIDVLLDLNRKTFERQGLKSSFPDELARRLDAACTQRGCRKLIIVTDDDGAPLSGYYFVWDDHSAYGLIGGMDPAHRQSGANSLCFWTTIEHAAGVTRQYNFCGSMIEPVAHFMRAFGAEQVPYFYISKTPSRLLTIRQTMLALIGGK